MNYNILLHSETTKQMKSNFLNELGLFSRLPHYDCYRTERIDQRLIQVNTCYCLQGGRSRNVKNKEVAEDANWAIFAYKITIIDLTNPYKTKNEVRFIKEEVNVKALILETLKKWN